MKDLLIEIRGTTGLVTMNRPARHNAFDDKLLKELQLELNKLIHDKAVRVIVLKSEGLHFSAGADLSWMQRMASFSQEENHADALVLAHVMHTLHKSPKPTIAMIQGLAFGGGAGLAAACDIAIATDDARFCFSEVKLGLIPAVISPYVVKAIGERAAKALFMSAELFSAQRAYELGLVQHVVTEAELLEFTLNYAQGMAKNAPDAIVQSKHLVDAVANQPIDERLIDYTASQIANKRVSSEGQAGIRAFLNKETPHWD